MNKKIAIERMSKIKSLFLIACVTCFAFSLDVCADGIRVPNNISGKHTEDLLVKSLMEITEGHLNQALDTVNLLLQSTPNFRLAQLVRGDLLMAQAQQFQSFGSASSTSEDVSDLRDEAKKRIEHYLSASKSDKLPDVIWQFSNEQKYAIVVDVDNSRLYLYSNNDGKPEYVADYYATIGKNGFEKHTQGDKRTPLGVYFTAPKLTKKLDEMYGDAAFPLNYPNEWDRRLGKTGNGIWLHGTPHNTYSRAPQASDGCIVVSNEDLNSMMDILQKGKVPFIVANHLQWIQKEASQDEKKDLMDSIETWRKDWQSQNTDIYLSHYSTSFSNGEMNFNRWSSEKRRIQSSKPDVTIKISNMSVFSYPGSPNKMAVVTFDQSFKSNVLDSQMTKRQYWVKENNHWKIIYEGSA